MPQPGGRGGLGPAQADARTDSHVCAGICLFMCVGIRTRRTQTNASDFSPTPPDTSYFTAFSHIDGAPQPTAERPRIPDPGAMLFRFLEGLLHKLGTWAGLMGIHLYLTD